MTYVEACKRAQDVSSDTGCVQHVNAVLGKDPSGDPCITGYTVSDWYDGSTVATFENGWPK